MKTLFISLALLGLAASQGCSSETDNGDHVWREQTDAIDKAKAVEQSLQDAVTRQKKQIDEQGR